MAEHRTNKSKKNWDKHSCLKNLKRQRNAIQARIDAGTARPEEEELLEELDARAASGGVAPGQRPKKKKKKKEPEVIRRGKRKE